MRYAEIINENRPWGAWFDPTTKRIIDISGSHERFIARYYPDLMPDQAFDQALNDGWVRITYPQHDHDGYSFNGQVEANVKYSVRKLLPDLRWKRCRVDIDIGSGWEVFDTGSGFESLRNWVAE